MQFLISFTGMWVVSSKVKNRWVYSGNQPEFVKKTHFEKNDQPKANIFFKKSTSYGSPAQATMTSYEKFMKMRHVLLNFRRDQGIFGKTHFLMFSLKKSI